MMNYHYDGGGKVCCHDNKHPLNMGDNEVHLTLIYSPQELIRRIDLSFSSALLAIRKCIIMLSVHRLMRPCLYLTRKM